ncbi:MMPL family transporter, partial [bacterium]|nr:MMPL family transporter [bacterium]
MNKLIQFMIDKPVKNILISSVFLFGVVAGMSQLTSNFSYRTFFEEDNPKLQEFDAFERRFGSDELALIAIKSPNGIFDTESIKLVQDLTADMWMAPEVIRVDSLTNFNYVYGEADDIFVEPLIPDDMELSKEYLAKRKDISINHKSIEGYLVNKAADVAMIYVRLKPSLKGTPDYQHITIEFRKIIEKYQGKGGHEIFLTGNPILNYAFQESSQADMKTLLPVVFMITILFLLLMFRRVTGVILPIIMIILTILATMGITGWIGFEINTITAIVPQFMVAISVAVSVHLLLSFFDVFKKGLTKEEAIFHAMTKNLRPTLLTAL